MSGAMDKSRRILAALVYRNGCLFRLSTQNRFFLPNSMIHINTRFSPGNYGYKRRFSGSSEPPTVSTSTNGSSKLTLKQLIRPFLMKFHPDRQGIENEKLTSIAREVNLEALQTLNGMIDTIDQIYNRAAEPSKFSLRGRLDLKKKYLIEFLVSTDDGKGVVKRPKDVPISSRRSVELLFSDKDISAVNTVDNDGKYSVSAALALRVKAMREISKLLRVAGLQIPKDLESQIEAQSIETQTESMSIREQLLHEELNLQSNQFGRNFGHGTRPKSQYELSREKYMRSTDFKKYNEMYDEALKDMEKDLATEGLMSMSEERMQRFVAEVISRVRVHESHIHEPSLDVLQQLIAIRRLSLLLSDNFETLEMEDMGRLWESIYIVLIPERKAKEIKTGLPYSRLKRLKKGKESGYKFAYNADDSVTAFVPIDFLDDELIKEFKTHLSDFYSLCLSRGGLDDYFPSYYSEFKGKANMNDD